MCPVLRGELPPIPSEELTGLRNDLERDWDHKTVSTPSGPLLVVRVPQEQPELIRDLEAATEQLPPLDLSGYRGAILMGDQAHLGVSIDMLRSLVATRTATEQQWLVGLGRQLPPGGFTVARLPSDPHRRLRVVVRVDTARVGEMTNLDFDRLAETHEKILAECPGGVPPTFAYLLAQEDHVRIDGDRFFKELDDRRHRIMARQDRSLRRKREENYEIVRGHLARLEERQNTRPSNLPPELQRSSRAPSGVSRTQSGVSRAPSDPARERRSRMDGRTPGSGHIHDRKVEGPPADLLVPRGRDRDREQGRRATTPHDPAIPTPSNSSSRTRTETVPFAAAKRHPTEVRHLKHLLEEAGYETRQELVVDGVPLALAAARPEGYPRRVLAAFYHRLKVDEARRVLRVARGAGAELALVIAPETEEGVERVTLATNLKVIAPEAVQGLRLD